MIIGFQSMVFLSFFVFWLFGKSCGDYFFLTFEYYLFQGNRFVFYKTDNYPSPMF